MHASLREFFTHWRTEIDDAVRESGVLCVAVFGADGDVRFASPAATTLLGSDPRARCINPPFADLVNAAHEGPLVFDGFLSFGQNGRADTSIKARVYRKDDDFLLIGEIDVRTLEGYYKNILRLNAENTALQRDLIREKRALENEVEERTRAEERVRALLGEKELILREAHHRIKNNMSTTIALLRLQLRTHTDPTVTAALQEAAGRLQGMMVLYDKLFRAGGAASMPLSDYLTPLIHEILGVFSGGIRIRASLEIGDIVLPAEILSSLGILINELVTNSAKYAFGEMDEGRISLSASRIDDRVRIEYEDNGRGLPESAAGATPGGFGMELILIIVKQIKGRLTMEKGAGARFVIEFPHPSAH